MKILAFSPNRIQHQGKFLKDHMKMVRSQDLSKMKVLLSENGFTSLIFEGGGGYYPWVVIREDSSGELVGGMRLAKRTMTEHLVSGSGVDEGYEGKGLGSFLYRSALHHYGTLTSSTSLSAGSTKLWKKLVEKFDGVLVIPFDSLYKEVSIIGWENKSGYLYPLVSKGGKAVSIRTLSKSKDPSEAESAGLSFFRIRG